MSPGARLRALIAERGVVEAMAAHSPLSAKLAVEAGFEAIWGSGFELSALYGLPDVGLVGFAEHLEMTRRMAASSGGLVIADLDTGFGNAVNAAHAVKAYEAAGAAAVVIEDKVFPKMTSLAPGGRQDLIRIEEYVGKLAAALHARKDRDFLVVARTEALIAGMGLEEALKRGRAYADAGADLLLVHSKASSPAEIEAFIAAWDRGVRLVVVPTSFPAWGHAEAAASGKVSVVIWGNHGVRASVKAMRDAFAAIRAAGSASAAEGRIASVADIFELQEMEALQAFETRYLR